MVFSLILAGLAAGSAASFLSDKYALKRPKFPFFSIKKAIVDVPQEESGTKPKSMSVAEAEAAHQQGVSLGAAGLFAVGAFTTPTIAWVGLLMLGYNATYMLRKIRHSLHKQANLSVVCLDFLSISFAILLGFFFTAALLFGMVFTASRLTAKTEREAQADFSRIFGELSDTAWLLQDGIEVEVPLSSLNEKDVIVVHSGNMIPVDGHIVAGEGMVDQHLLTGESQPVEKKTGDEVLTSTLLLAGSVQIRVYKKGSETITGQIAKTLEHAASFKHKVESRGEYLTEKGAFYTLLASGLTLPFLGINQAVAISYSGFGYQMRMAAPLMVLNYLRIVSRNGILVKDGRVLDTLHVVDTVIFDKTGTLTEDVPQVERVIACDSFTERQLLQYAASAEQRQKHPIAQAIIDYAQQQNIILLNLEHSEYAIGHGLQATLVEEQNGEAFQIKIGSQRFIQSSGIKLPEPIALIQKEADDKGYSVVYVACEQGQLIGAIELRPVLRPQASDSIAALNKLGMRVYIISGDREKTTRHLAQSLGIDNYFAETLPQDKAKHVEMLQARGHKVCFVGDGINDSVALQKADVSISLHGAATIAQDTADIVLMNPDLSNIPYLLNMSKELDQRMSFSEQLNLGSGFGCVVGVFLFGMGTSGAMLFYSAGLLANLGNALLPLFAHRQVNLRKATKRCTINPVLK